LNSPLAIKVATCSALRYPSLGKRPWQICRIFARVQSWSRVLGFSRRWPARSIRDGCWLIALIRGNGTSLLAMRITSWNILHGMAIPPAPNQQAGALSQAGAKIAAELSPEVIAIQECDYQLARTGHVNQIAEVATSIGARYFALHRPLLVPLAKSGESLAQLIRQSLLIQRTSQISKVATE